MKSLAPLVRLLQRSLRRLLLRRGLIWAACAALLVVLGGALVQVFGSPRLVHLGLILGVLSVLPAFLLWPPSEQRLKDRFRQLDQGMVFEAYLEAEPGEVRDLLSRLATERAAALDFLKPPREPLLAGLGWFFAAAVLCIGLVEAGSTWLLGRPLMLGLAPPPATTGGVRIEEQGYSEFATEDPAARQARRERFLNQRDPGNLRGEKVAVGRTPATHAGNVSGQQASSAAAASSGAGSSSVREAIAKRKQGDVEDGGTGPDSAPGSAENRKGTVPGTEPQPSGITPGEQAASERRGVPSVPGQTGQGYDHTADTKVPSPLLDYRSSFEARYAERTGRHLSASGRLSFGELRDFQRRYFDSFSLKAEVGAAEDPYVALLKQRWAERKGGLR